MELITIKVIITICTLLFAGLTFATYNLYSKNIKLEQKVITYESYLESISETIKVSKENIDFLDAEGLYQTGDQLQTFFEMIKTTQEIYNLYNLNKDD